MLALSFSLSLVAFWQVAFNSQQNGKPSSKQAIKFRQFGGFEKEETNGGRKEGKPRYSLPSRSISVELKYIKK